MNRELIEMEYRLGQGDDTDARQASTAPNWALRLQLILAAAAGLILITALTG